MAATFPVKFSKAIRNKVAKASDNGPSIGEWLDRVRDINDPALTEAIAGIWCGRDGEARIEIPGANSLLCVGWYHKRVEWSYLS